MFVITGGGSGLGRALAIALAKRNDPVLVVGRDEAALMATAACSPNIRYESADVTQALDRQRLVRRITSLGTIQGLIHNAGIIEPITSMQTITETDFRACLMTNLEAPLFLTQALLPQLTDARVLHIGSGAAHFPVTGWAAYCVSKAALAMLTRCWQLEYPSLAMASVMPGIADTPMQAVIRDSKSMTHEKQDFFCRLHQTNRLLSPETVALFLIWLLIDLPRETYSAQEWDIYDKQYHPLWLTPPHQVPELE